MSSPTDTKYSKKIRVACRQFGVTLRKLCVCSAQEATDEAEYEGEEIPTFCVKLDMKHIRKDCNECVIDHPAQKQHSCLCTNFEGVDCFLKEIVTSMNRLQRRRQQVGAMDWAQFFRAMGSLEAASLASCTDFGALQSCLEQIAGN